MADQKSPAQFEQQGEEWINSIKDALDAQTELFVTGLRLWRRAWTTSVEVSSGFTQSAARLTAATAGAFASNATEAASRATQSMHEALDEGMRTVRQQATNAKQTATS